MVAEKRFIGTVHPHESGQPGHSSLKRGLAAKASRIKNEVWDPKTRKFLGKTPSHWALCAVFYTVFYTSILVFFGACMAVTFVYYIDKRSPMVYGNAGAIGNNPGLSFRPMPWAKSTMIYFVQGDKQSFAPIIANIRAHLIQYENQNQDGRNFIQCGYGVRPREKVCTFNLDLLGPCIWKEEYGYNDGEPCVILKLNKLYGWEPEPYDNNTRPPELGDRWRPDHVGVTCEGDTDTDKENMGPIAYYPEEGFPNYYFPYLNQLGYRSPLVAVHFERPTNNVLLRIVCKAWAKNIEHNLDPLWLAGVTKFEILVDGRLPH